MSEWLSRKKIETLALELITPEFIDRVDDRIMNLQDEYGKDNIVKLIDKMILVLEQCLNKFSGIINRSGIKLTNNNNRLPTDQYKLEMDAYKDIRSGKFVVNQTEDEINKLKDSLKVHTSHFVMYHIQGVRGKISWNEINNVIEQVKEAKVSINFNNENNTNSKLPDNYVEEIDSLEKLMNGKLDVYVNILKKILETENRLPIQKNGTWIRSRGDYSIVIAWIDSLEQSNKLKMSNLSKQQKTNLLNKHFIGLNMNDKDTSLWRKAQTTYYKYKQLFDKEISMLNK